jgi:hypothetical protein
MNKLAIAAIAIAIATLAGCAQLPGSAAGGSASYEADGQRPSWLRDPAQGEYPFSPRGW